MRPPKASTPDTPDFSPEAIAEALNEATPGPWQAREGWNLMPPMRYEIAAPDVEKWSVVEAGDNDWGPAGGVNKKGDAHLIANAPTWLAQLLAALEASERERERLVDDMKTAVWQFNEAVSLLREARLYVPETTGCAEEIDESLPAIQAALEHSAAALAPTTPARPEGGRTA